MKKMIVLTAVILGVFSMITISCGKSTPKEGGSCKGIGPMDGIAACDGQKVIVCSSYTKYKYIVMQTCPANKKCVAAADKKSAGCK